jgi:integration host factor subunit beta
MNVILDGFTGTLKQGGRIEIRGFGAFSVRYYGAYPRTNPETGDRIDVKEKKGAFFKVRKELKERVNILVIKRGQHEKG